MIVSIYFFSRLIASFFFIGYAKKIPGTLGSLAGLIVWALFLSYFSSVKILFVIFLVTLVMGWWCADYYVKVSGIEDPQIIVIDEVLGIWITFAGIASLNLPLWIAGFCLFRFFDILKPLGIRRLEKIKGGAGVIADDLLAGFYANLILRIVSYHFFK